VSTNDQAAREAEAQLAQHYLDTAVLGREVSNLALQQALRDAKAGQLRDPAKTAVSAITASAIALDKRLILQERPTQIHAVDPAGTLTALAKRVGLTIDTTSTELPPVQTSQPEPPAQPATPPTQSLVSEAERAKPRARTRKKPAPKRAD
jgi:hypothetical protein